jgi:predicted 3-demethylubiquinone-9 3-methyltransferase (glyoxalase superfamily)
MNKIATCLLFDGQAEEAAAFYISIFPQSAVHDISRYGEGAPFPSGTALLVSFALAGQPFQTLNGGADHRFSQAISLSVSCKDEAEVDRYWNALISDGGAPARCGWLTDRYGVSWQIVPEGLSALLSDPDPARAARAMQAMLAMSKIDLAAIRTAADGA